MKILWISQCPLSCAKSLFQDNTVYFSEFLNSKDKIRQGRVIKILAYNANERDYINWLGKIDCEVLIVFSIGNEQGLLDFFNSFAAQLFFFQGINTPYLELPISLSNWLRPQLELWWKKTIRSDFEYLGFEIMSSFDWQRSITRRNLGNCLKILWQAQGF